MSRHLRDMLPLLDAARKQVGEAQLGFAAAADPLVSIVIPIHNQLQLTLGCLKSIAAHGGEIPLEVLVVDDASDLSVFLALQAVPGLRLLRNFSNLGYLRSCNRGAANARGRYLVLLNNDTEVTPGWLEALLRVFRERPDAGLVGCKLVYPDGKLQEAGSIVWRDGNGWNYGKGEDPGLPFFNYLREADYCSAACVAMPVAWWRRLAGFDSAYAPAYYEDADLAFRIRAGGGKVYYQPHATVIHHEGRSHGTDTASGLKRHQERNREHFHARWEDALAEQFPPGQEFFRARDRSSGKKTILFIDHYVPHRDQDAGSRCLWMYIEAFCAAGFSVKFIGDNFAEDQPYQAQLEELGVEVLTGGYMATHWRDWLTQNGKYLDYVFFIRAYTCAQWVEPVRNATKAKLLFYGVDLISRTQMRAYRDLGDSRHLDEARIWEEKETFVISRVDVTYYPSPDEVAELRAKFPGKQIEHIPLYAFPDPPESSPYSARERRDLLFVGSSAHPPNVDAMHWFLEHVFPDILRRIPHIRIHVVGRNPPAVLTNFANPHIIFHGYVTDSELDRLYRSSRLVVAPLRVGGGIKGKLLEAFYKGTPAITTEIGIEGIPATDRQCGIVHRLSDFAAETVAIYENPPRLADLSREARKMVARHYSLQALRRALAKGVSELNVD